MGALEATVKIIGELAWPIVVMVSVVLLRRQLGRLIVRLTHAEVPGGKFDFAEQAAATNELAEAAVPNAPVELPAAPAPGDDTRALAPSPTLNDLLDEADRHPVGGMVRAWSLIEGLLVDEAHRRPGYSVTAAMRALEIAGLTSDDVVGLSERLSRLRARVVHGQQIPDCESARDFVEATWRLATVLRQNIPLMASEDWKPPHGPGLGRGIGRLIPTAPVVTMGEIKVG